MMERIMKELNELHEMNHTYALPNEEVEALIEEARAAKVCTPIVGKFSSGKSALLNTLLGYSSKLLKEDITPETAVPAEITYSPDQDSICVVRNDGSQEQLTVAAYRQLEVDAQSVRCTRLSLNNSILEEIPDVMLVDMPGFESGYEVHNRAIDNYLPNSLAYIIAFPADDMIVRSSVGNILKELCLHDMPICIAITKYDKRNDDFEDTFAAMKESLKRFIGEREVTYCITSSYSGDAEELEDFLRGIQVRSQQILANRFSKKLLAAADATEGYLRTRLSSSSLTESELDEQEERFGRQLDSMNSRFAKEKEDFDRQIADSVEEIKADVQKALEAEQSTFVTMAMNNQSINERLNLVVRSAVTTSIQKRLLPKVDKYLKRVENCISGESIGNLHIAINLDTQNINKGLVSTTVAAVAAVCIGGLLIGGIIAAFIAKISSDKRKEERRNNIRMKLNSEVFPQVLQEVGDKLEVEIAKQIQMVNTSIDEEITAQRNALEQAMEEVRARIADEKEQKENLLADMRADVERIQQIKSGR